MGARQTTKVLEARGTLKRHSGRAAERAAEPKNLTPLPNKPPASLRGVKAGVEVWKDVFTKVPPNVMATLDEYAVETLVRAILKMRSPFASSADFAFLFKILSSFGMTPASRVNAQQFNPVDSDGKPIQPPAPEPGDLKAKFTGLRRVA